jgi:hypothetical protein
MTTSTPIPTSDDLAAAIESLSEIPPSRVITIPKCCPLHGLILLIHTHVISFGRDMEASLVFESEKYLKDPDGVITALQTLKSESLIVLGETKITPRTKFFTIYPRSEFGPKDN